MENWQTDFEWLRIRHFLKDKFKKNDLPDLNAALFLLGIQVLGRWKAAFTKEEKQDLMHISLCELLTQEGVYEFVGRDHDGWPHYKALKQIDTEGVAKQEEFIKELIIKYFNQEQFLENEEE